MVTKVPRWHGSSYAERANAEDSGRPGRQPVNVRSERHEEGLEAFAKNAVKKTKKAGGSDTKALKAGEKAHNAAEKTIKPKGK